MLSDGYPLVQVAEFIQDECGEYVDIQRESLVTILSDYRKATSTGDTAATNAPRAYLEVAREMKKGVKIVDELEELFSIQKARIMHFAEMEESAGTMSKGLGREIDAARLLLDELHRVRLDLGVDERHIGTLTIKAEAIAATEERYGQRIANVMRDPEKRRRVLTLLEAALRETPELEAPDVIEGEAEVVEEVG